MSTGEWQPTPPDSEWLLVWCSDVASARLLRRSGDDSWACAAEWAREPGYVGWSRAGLEAFHDQRGWWYRAVDIYPPTPSETRQLDPESNAQPTPQLRIAEIALAAKVHPDTVASAIRTGVLDLDEPDSVGRYIRGYRDKAQRRIDAAWTNKIMSLTCCGDE